MEEELLIPELVGDPDFDDGDNDSLSEDCYLSLEGVIIPEEIQMLKKLCKNSLKGVDSSYATPFYVTYQGTSAKVGEAYLCLKFALELRSISTNYILTLHNNAEPFEIFGPGNPNTASNLAKLISF